MIKFRVFIDTDKEEDWINDIQKQGYRLKSNTLDMIYKFEKSDQPYITRIDYQDTMSREKFNEYVALHEDFRWEHIRGGRFGFATQTWSKVPDGNDEIFSDKESKVNFYKRYMNFTGLFALLFMVYTIIFVFPLDGITLFLTPGLWDLPAGQFWPAFLFELPFAILRLAPVLLFPILTAVFVFAYSKMDKIKKNMESEIK